MISCDQIFLWISTDPASLNRPSAYLADAQLGRQGGYLGNRSRRPAKRIFRKCVLGAILYDVCKLCGIIFREIDIEIIGYTSKPDVSDIEADILDLAKDVWEVTRDSVLASTIEKDLGLTNSTAIELINENLDSPFLCVNPRARKDGKRYTLESLRNIWYAACDKHNR